MQLTLQILDVCEGREGCHLHASGGVLPRPVQTKRSERAAVCEKLSREAETTYTVPEQSNVRLESVGIQPIGGLSARWLASRCDQ